MYTDIKESVKRGMKDKNNTNQTSRNEKYTCDEIFTT